MVTHQPSRGLRQAASTHRAAGLDADGGPPSDITRLTRSCTFWNILCARRSAKPAWNSFCPQNSSSTSYSGAAARASSMSSLPHHNDVPTTRENVTINSAVAQNNNRARTQNEQQ